ncbi:MAG: CPBP family intramembrane glutamic endopeptidase [Gilvibacter sp.]
MLGNIVLLLISWGLLYHFERKNLSALGFRPITLRLKELLLGFALIAILLLISIAVETWIFSIKWEAVKDFGLAHILKGLYYYFNSALFEDLIFRGAILYILWKKIGATKAIWISAFFFGVYHWFSFGMFSSGIIPMLYVLVITGFVGWAWAYTYIKTESIVAGLGMHISWNFCRSLFYENSPYGNMLYVMSEVDSGKAEYYSIYSLIQQLVVPLLIILAVHYYHKIKSGLPKSQHES